MHDLQRKLTEWTGKRWMVVVSKEQGEPTLRAQAEAREAELKRGVAGRSAGAGGAGALSRRDHRRRHATAPPEAEDVIAPPPEEDED